VCCSYGWNKREMVWRWGVGGGPVVKWQCLLPVPVE
jgi:hypothetical protein